MKEIPIYQVDAFAEKLFQGNPAAVCPLSEWIPDRLLQNIASENNLSETAFVVPYKEGFQLRWFTPNGEVELCGHATLATAHVLFKHLHILEETIEFYTKSGTLYVSKYGNQLKLDFPASLPVPVSAPEALLTGLTDQSPIEVLSAYDYIVVLSSEEELRSLNPNLDMWKTLDLRGVVVTAQGDNCDFVSRCFFPKYGVPEDPVTGSAHCELAPYWSLKLQKESLMAIQLSKRKGFVNCQMSGNRTLLIGSAVDYLQGTIMVEDLLQA